MRTRVNVFVVILYFIFQGNVFSLDNISIRITPDEFPEDIHWELQNADYKILVQSNLVDCEPFIACNENFLISNENCYRFIIEDRQFDRESDPWQFEVLFNGEVVISRFMVDSVYVDSFGCTEFGNICEAATVIHPDSMKISWPPVQNYWMSFRPVTSGLYQILNCDLNEQRRYPPTQLWVYDECFRDLQNGPEGAIAFSEKFSFCPPSSGINAIPLTGGKEYYFRLKLLDNTFWTDSIALTIERFDENPGCTDPDACNYYPFATSDDGSCFYEACAPDLEIDQLVFEESILFDSIEQNDVCLINEGCLRGPGLRYIVRFSTLIKNIGDADYIIGSPEENDGSFSNNNCHQHYHHLGYAEYLLYAGNGDPEPIGFKNGFCVQDSECPTNLQRYFCNYMGITAGCEDLYGNDILCQWVDITDVPDGQYTLVARINWSRLPDIRGYFESSYDNNWAQICLQISRSNGIPEIEILETCDPYTDCLGFSFGQAEIDCSNVCGGNAEFADLNDSGEIDDADIEEYLFSLADHSLSSDLCFDLDRDGDISVYDIIIADDCLADKKQNADNLFHEHCLLPAGQYQIEDSLRLSIENIDTSTKTLDIAYRSRQRDIIALEFMMEGIDIEFISLTRTPFFYDYNDREVFIFNSTPLLQRNSQQETFMTITYDSINIEQLCISDIEAVNSLKQEIFAFSGNQSNCSFLTNTVSIDDIQTIDVFPNPVQADLTIRSSDLKLSTLVILSIHGQIIHQQPIQNTGVNQIDLSKVRPGIYVLKLLDANGEVYLQKLIKQ